MKATDVAVPLGEDFAEIRDGVRRIAQIAPISTNLVLAYIGEHVLGMPRSY